MPEDPRRWLSHSRMTDPGREAALLTDLPTDVGALCRIIQGVLIHSDWLAAYDLPGSHGRSRETLPLSERLRQIVEADSRPLAVARTAALRSTGTCRDYALMLCGMLRQQGIPARVRCGFAAYFTGNAWEDHWLCEHWLAAEDRWCRTDAQLDGVLQQRLGIRFDATDVPPDMFITADDAWRRCRTGADDPANFGHGTARGLWFVRVNVVRDHYALNGAEVSPWDSWRRAVGRHESLADADREATDAIACDAAQAPGREIAPPWTGETVT